MNIKLFFIALILIVVLGVSSVALAQTMTEAQRQTLIAQLQAQIIALTQQINAILAQRQQQAGGAVTAVGCYTFENNIGFAQSGTTEVVNLHAVLQKEGISYAPDDSSTYSTGTLEAVKQFQIKYKIAAPTAGYVGATTREKLNQIYKCAVVKCTSSWQNGPWTTCVNNQQTRTVVDANNCPTPTSKPATTQSCTTKPIDISVDNSDGPLDIFVTLGSGATVNSLGINLTKTINLKWTGVNVASCTASDSLTPAIFSGFQPSTGFLSVTMSGVIKTTTLINKISDTFKISCISTLTGNAVSDSVAVDLFYTANSNCTPSWQLGAWSSCVSGKKTRTVIDANGCGSLVGKPETTETCIVANCTPLWQPGTWSACVEGKQTRTVIDAHNCGVTTGKLATSQTCCSAICLDPSTGSDGVYALSCSGGIEKCDSGRTCELTYSTSYVNNNGAISTVRTLSGSHCICVPNWVPGDWGVCNVSGTSTTGTRTRTVTDSNNCGTTTGKLPTGEPCTVQ